MVTLHRWIGNVFGASGSQARRKGGKHTSSRSAQRFLPSLEGLEGRLAPAMIATVAGNGVPAYSGDNGPAISAHLNNPSAVAVDSHGDIFIADAANNVIREVNGTTGVITTVAGTGTAGYSGDNGQATSAQLKDPIGVAVDSAGDLFIADAGNYVIREVNGATHVITTVAGNGTAGYGGDTGPATNAQLDDPTAVAVDSSGDLYIADAGNYVIREVNGAAHVITTVAGDGTQDNSGDNGPATSAQLNDPTGVAVDTQGNLFIADAGSNVIREVNGATGVITTVAGNGTQGYKGDNGPATSAELNGPSGVAVDSAGNLYIADAGNNVIREAGPSVNAPPPTIAVTQTSLSFGTITQGTTGSLQPININGSNLTGPVTVMAPSGVQLSGNGTTWVSSLAVTPTGGTVAATIDVRISPTAPTGAINGPIAVTSTGATEKDITVTGNTVASSNSDAPPTVTPASLSLGTVNQGTPGPVESFTISGGSSLPAQYSLGPLAGVQLLSADGKSWVSSLTLPTTGGTLISPTIVRIRISPTAATGAISGSIGPVSVTGQVNANSLTPTITPSTTSLNLGTTNQGTPGSVASFTICGSNLKPGAGITITPPAGGGVQLSINGSPWGSSSVTLNQTSSGTVASTIVRVRISPTAPLGAISGQIIFSSTNATNQNVTLSGTVVGPTITVNPSDTSANPLNLGTTTQGTAGNTVQSYTVCGTGLTGPITISAPIGLVQVSKDNGSTWSTSVSLPQSSSGTVAATTILVCISKGAPVETFPASTMITNTSPTSSGTTEQDVYVTGTVNPCPATANISTVAGTGTAGYSGNNVPATSARLNSPTGVAEDSMGNIYFADTANSVIREVNGTTGVITTVAGIPGSAGYTGDGGLATVARLNSPEGVAVDSAGNLYIADSGNNVIREVNHLTGNISTLTSGNGSINLNHPDGVALDATGQNLYIADTGNGYIWKLPLGSSSPTLTPVIQAGVGFNGNNGIYTMLKNPVAVAVDNTGNYLYIADSGNNLIRKVNLSTNVVSYVVGNYSTYTEGPGYSGDGGPATNAQLYMPTGVAMDSQGDLFIADAGNNVIREVFATGANAGDINTVAGDGSKGYSGNGGLATSAQLNNPNGIAVEDPNDFIIADTSNNVIRYVGVAVPTITVSSSSVTPPSTTQGTPGNAGSYVISGSDLTKPITITAPPTGEVQLSVNGGPWVSSVTLSPNKGTVPVTTIDVRISIGAPVGAYTRFITNTSLGAVEQDVSVNVNVNAKPAPTITMPGLTTNTYGTPQNLGATTQGTAGTGWYYMITASNLTGSVTITPPPGGVVQLSVNGGAWGSSAVTLSPNSSHTVTATIAVRIGPGASKSTFVGGALPIRETTPNGSGTVTEEDVWVTGTVM